MSLALQFEASLHILLAVVLCGVIGINRERHEHPAGLRTHILVGVGSCVFTLLSVYAFPGDNSGRVAAQVVTGIGFLGAGAILKDRGHITGLTTAASLWTTAAIGMAVGSGAWFLAITLTLIIWFVLALVRRFARVVLVNKPHATPDP